MSESAHELAEMVRKLDENDCRRSYEYNFGIKCHEYKYCDECRAALRKAVSDRIEALEVPDMSRFVELPIDTDGIPWHIGDVMECGDVVAVMFLEEKGWTMLVI